MNDFETVSLTAIGESLHSLRANYWPDPGYLDELKSRCSDPVKAQALFDYHVQAYLKKPNAEHFFQAYALLSLIGALSLAPVQEEVQ